MLHFKDTLSWRLWVAKKQAQSLPTPERWLAKIEAIEDLLSEPSRNAARLVELLVQYARANVASSRAIVWAVRRDEPPPKRAGLDSELLHIAQSALQHIGPPGTQALLQAYMESTLGSQERSWLLSALGQLGDPSLEALFHDLVDDERDGGTARRGLAVIEARTEEHLEQEARVSDAGENEEYDQLIAALSDENYLTRWRAADALAELCDAGALEPLRGSVQDPSEYVRQAARDAIAMIEAASTGAPNSDAEGQSKRH